MWFHTCAKSLKRDKHEIYWAWINVQQVVDRSYNLYWTAINFEWIELFFHIICSFFASSTGLFGNRKFHKFVAHCTGRWGLTQQLTLSETHFPFCRVRVLQEFARWRSGTFYLNSLLKLFRLSLSMKVSLQPCLFFTTTFTIWQLEYNRLPIWFTFFFRIEMTNVLFYFLSFFPTF